MQHAAGKNHPAVCCFCKVKLNANPLTVTTTPDFGEKSTAVPKKSKVFGFLLTVGEISDIMKYVN